MAVEGWGVSASSTDLLAFDEGRLTELLVRFAGLRVAVLGDFFLDKYLEVDPRLAELSLETGRTAHQVVQVRHSPGAAGTVANNLASLMGKDRSGSISAIGFSGDDGEGFELRRDLGALGVDLSEFVLDKTPGRRTPVYLKPRDLERPELSGEHDRYDLKNRLPTGRELEASLSSSIRRLFAEVDLFVVMDQVEEDGFGAVTPGIRDLLGRLAGERRGKAAPLLWADSRRRIGLFPGFIRKMNEFELLGIPDPKPGSSVPEDRLLERVGTSEAAAGAPVFVTAGARGVWVNGPEGPVLVPAVAVDGPVDPTGAGDSFTAGAALALAAGAGRQEAALLGCLAASVTVRKLGTTGNASAEELREALRIWKGQRR